MAEEEVFRGPTPEQWREDERRLEVENKRREDRRNEREEDRRNERVEDKGNEEEQETTFRFPILDTSIILGEEVKMKNIPPSILPNFYGMNSKDLDSFLF